MQLAGWNGTECVPINQPNLGCRGTAGQPRNVAAWQFPVLPLVDGIFPEIQPPSATAQACLSRLTDRSPKPCETHAGCAGEHVIL